MTAITDPALELAELCETLRSGSDHLPGEQVLAGHFNVEPQSAEFYEIVFVLIRRLEELSMIIQHSTSLQHLKDEADQHLNTLKRAFTRDGLQNQWSHAKTNFLSAATVSPVKFLSSALRPQFAYVRLSDEEINLLIGEVDELLAWLVDHQLMEQDFFRAAIIEGLGVLRFRLERLRWLGWGYSLEGLKSVIQAYLALNGRIPNRNDRPDAGVILMKVFTFVKRVCKVAHIAKEADETSDFLVDAYGKITTITGVKNGAVGLLGSSIAGS
jgi:hypothetical protein